VQTKTMVGLILGEQLWENIKRTIVIPDLPHAANALDSF